MLGLALLPALLAFLIAAFAQPPTSPVAIGRVALAALAFAAYLFTYVFIALAASARSGSVRSALVMGLSFWALTTVVAPRVASEVAARLHLTPIALDFQAQVNRITWGNDFAVWDRREHARKAEARRRYGVEPDRELPVNIAVNGNFSRTTWAALPLSSVGHRSMAQRRTSCSCRSSRASTGGSSKTVSSRDRRWLRPISHGGRAPRFAKSLEQSA